MYHGLKHKMKNYTTFRRKIGENHLGKGFLDWTPKAQLIKGKTDKMNSIKIKNFCSGKTLLRL